MSRDGYLPPGVEQEDIDRHFNGDEGPHGPRCGCRDCDNSEPPDEYDALDIIDRKRRDEEIGAELAREVKAERPEPWEEKFLGLAYPDESKTEKQEGSL